MKYVAFLDILGFKQKLKGLNQKEAKTYINDFSTTIANVWRSHSVDAINGYIVSDSVIIYSNDTSIKALQQLISVIDAICKESFKVNTILVRGAIAKGEFDELKAEELSSLKNGLIVGQAYIDAYLLEGTVKTLGIVLSKDVHDDYLNAELTAKQILHETLDGETYNIYRYLELEFLSEPQNLVNFIKLATSANWLPHYYNALYFALKHETAEKKINQVFSDIITVINNDSPTENWRTLDMFIKNAFESDVIRGFQTRFLKFLRGKIS